MPFEYKKVDGKASGTVDGSKKGAEKKGKGIVVTGSSEKETTSATDLKAFATEIAVAVAGAVVAKPEEEKDSSKGSTKK